MLVAAYGSDSSDNNSGDENTSRSRSPPRRNKSTSHSLPPSSLVSIRIIQPQPPDPKGLKRAPKKTVQLTISLRYQRIILQTMMVKTLALLRSHARIVAALAPPPCSPSFLLQKWLLQSRQPLNESLAVGRALDSFSITHLRRGLKTRP